jgi:hypothetical protein
MQRFLITLFLIINISLFGQESYTLQGVVINERGEKITNVEVMSANEQMAITKNGLFFVEMKLNNIQSFTFNHIGYVNKTYKVKKNWPRKAKNDTLVRYFKLETSSNELDPVDISFNNKPKRVFGSDTIGVEDFELLEDKILLLGSTKSLKRQSTLYLTDRKQEILHTLYLPDIAVELVRDFRKEIHVICQDKVFHVAIKNDSLNLEYIDEEYFYTYLAPIVDTIKTDLYFSNYSENYPAFEYSSYNREDSIVTKIRTIEDKLMMELYRSEFKYVDVRTKIWALEMEQESGIDKEVWVGATHFTSSIYYEELYAPMFKKQDSLFIFDHYDDYIFKYHTEKGLIDSVPITYQLKPMRTGWKKNMVQDSENEAIYAHFDNAGYAYLKKINTNNGQVAKTHKLFYRYVEKIRVKNGYAYYIYRPFESMQEKFIYREKLK